MVGRFIVFSGDKMNTIVEHAVPWITGSKMIKLALELSTTAGFIIPRLFYRVQQNVPFQLEDTGAEWLFIRLYFRYGNSAHIARP